MGPLFWGIVLVVYPLIQIPLVLYASKWVEMDDDVERTTEWTAGPPAGIDTGGESEPEPVDARPGVLESISSCRSGSGSVCCERCGTLNAGGYTYCRECVAVIG